MATSSARLRAFVSFVNSSIPSFNSSTSAAASKTSQRFWRSIAAGVFAVWLLLGASATGQAQTDAQAASPTRSAEQTPRVIPPPMSFPTAEYFRNHPAARSQFLSQLKQRSASSVRPSKKRVSPAFGGTWQLGPFVTNDSPICNPLLLTDGTVIAGDCGIQGNWYKLTPDITGSYVNGTWSQIATMPVFSNLHDTQYAPLYFASAVLPDGRVLAMGGEYNWQAAGSYASWTNLGAIYDPVANTWTPVSAPAGSSWAQIGDAQSTVLADGTFLLASCCGYPDVDALFDATNLTWTSTGAPNAGQLYQDEQGYTLLPNGNVLTVDIWTDCNINTGICSGPNPTNAEQYNPSNGTWSGAGNTVVSLVDPIACGNYEIGPAPLRPDGTVVQFGGDTGCSGDADPTGIYDSTTGVWSAGPNIPEVCGSNGTTQCDLADAPAAVLPNGNILFAAETGYGEAPTHFFEFTTLNAINQVADDAGASFVAAFNYNFLVLPNGQILTTIEDVDQPEFYTPTGSPDPSWAPVISTSPSNVYPGTTYTITGTQLNGLTQGAYYGDDFQMATNYPIVQITNSATGHVFYGRTFNISNRSIAPGASVSTNFTVPANIEQGASSLVVIANGIPSAPVPIGIAVPVPGVGVTSGLNPSAYGQAVSFTATVTGTSPTGSVQFNIDGKPFGSPVTLASGSATSGTISTLTAGPHTVTAVYSGDTNNAAGTGTLAGGQTVNLASTSVGVTSSPNPSTFGQSVTLTATINGEFGLVRARRNTKAKPQDVGGSVTWSANTGCGTTAVTSGNPGVASCVTTTLPAGNDAITATYSGDNNHSGNSGTLSGGQQVNQQSLVASPGSLNFGNKVVGGSHPKNVLVENSGPTNVMIGSVSITTTGGDPSAFTFHEYCAHPLKPGKTCVIGVTFRPDATGLDTATLNIPSTDPGSPLEVPITGTGVNRK
ncbi:MAG: Ig-like domain repeat protein [Terriglobales bacterium]